MLACLLFSKKNSFLKNFAANSNLPGFMNDKTSKTLLKWGEKIKKDVYEISQTSLSLDQLEKFIEDEDLDGIISELTRMKKLRKKLKKKALG